MSPLVGLLYVSEISSLDSGYVEAIRKESVPNNERDDITGLLLFDGWSFCQYVEGTGVSIAALLRRLQRDARHKDLRILQYDAVEQRSFSGWRLGFAFVADPDAIRRVTTRGRGDQLETVRLLARESGAS